MLLTAVVFSYTGVRIVNPFTIRGKNASVWPGYRGNIAGLYCEIRCNVVAALDIGEVVDITGCRRCKGKNITITTSVTEGSNGDILNKETRIRLDKVACIAAAREQLGTCRCD
jgi:hypothetical protein